MINERNFDGASDGDTLSRRGDKDAQKRRCDRRVRTAFASALTLGLVVGLALNGSGSRVDAQVPGANEPAAFHDYANEYAAPRVTTNAAGTSAKFSRPLEVPPLYAFDSALDESGARQIVIVDSETKRISVYWIRPRDVNSTIELVATRNFELDLKLENFNGEGLSPSQIREQLESTRP